MDFLKDVKGWDKKVQKLDTLLRLRSFPVAFRMLENREWLNHIPYLRRIDKRLTLCQMINLVRNFDWTVGAEGKDFIFPTCSSIIGLGKLPEIYTDGTFRSIVWVKKKEDARRFEESIPRLPLGKYEAVALAPLRYNPFHPDIVLIYGNPAQMILLINAIQLESYQVMQFFCVGESSCADVIVRSIQERKAYLTIPCYGERRYGHAQDDELVMAIPAEMIDMVIRGLEGLYRRGVRYPISYAGVESDLLEVFPPAYRDLDIVEKVRSKGRRLVVGLSGGIASGKSTVSGMLRERGAHIIDFDILAREVVKPGRPAWKDIVEYFGRQILAEDNTIDRKRLSEIVFKDMEKRKKLESFTHPRIMDEFLIQMEEITQKEDTPIIVVDIPLLFELNLQYRFLKNILVFVPKDIQIERLIQRDGIDEAEAEARLRAQLPMEEKLGYADYIIYNDKEVTHTERQVDRLWSELKRLRDEIKIQKKEC
ncbi:MAG TPA: dephospho-CoA kinase [Desulfobacteraceae bacterium]|nr:dephospho-CoA kinase [Desulfobacteraceae bacterium]